MINEMKGTTPATLENMHKHYAPGVFAFSPITGEKYSADPSDYWTAKDDWTMEDSEGFAMVLAVSVLKDVAS